MSICSFIIAALLAAASIGFEVDSKRDFIIAELIHRDSYMSQLNNSLKVTTSLDRINNFDSSSIHDIDARDIASVVTSNRGHYLMKIFIGQEKLLKVSTTLASTWIFSEPCEGCHTESFPAESTECRLLRSYKTFEKPSDVCGYHRRDKRGLNTHGVLSGMTSSFGSSSGTEGDQFYLRFVSVHESEDDKLDNSIDGLVGLGPGPYSLITLLAGQLKMAKKFSYCLLHPYHKFSKTNSRYSKIIFGHKTSISAGKVTTIPFTTKYAQPYYFIRLYTISLGYSSTSGETVSPKELVMNKDFIIDVESVKTRFPTREYKSLVKIIKKDFMVDYDPLPAADHFSLCYSTEENAVYRKLPSIIVSFDNGEYITLSRSNMFGNVDGGKVCMMVEPVKDDADTPVLGTLAQMGFEVEYDLDKSEISFAEADCKKFGMQ